MIKQSVIRSLAFAIAVGSIAVADAAPGWLTNYQSALKLSKVTGKPIVVDFHGSDWCQPCIMLKKEVFDKPDFKNWAKDHAILLSVDFPQHTQLSKFEKKQNDALSARYGVQFLPTVLVLDANGKSLGQVSYSSGGPKPWISSANKLIALRSWSK